MSLCVLQSPVLITRTNARLMLTHGTHGLLLQSVTPCCPLVVLPLVALPVSTHAGRPRPHNGADGSGVLSRL
jgi:hypothetical protein